MNMPRASARASTYEESVHVKNSYPTCGEWQRLYEHAPCVLPTPQLPPVMDARTAKR